MNLRTSKPGQLVVFFVLAFIIGWLAWIPLLIDRAFPTFIAFIFLFSPAISALVMTAYINGTVGIKDLLKRYTLWNFHIKWYLLAFLLLPAIFLLAALISFHFNLQSLWTNSPWYFIVASFLFLTFINSGEEIGWRGFALPRLQEVFGSTLPASILLGVIWGLWHLPEYFFPGPNIPLTQFLFFIAGLSIIYTVLFNNTRGSLLLAVILHASTDIVPRIIHLESLTDFSWTLIAGIVWITGIVLFFLTKNSTSNERVTSIGPNSI